MSNTVAINKKELGAYYTPPELTNVLVDWAICDSKEKVLEPSFGGCGFLESCDRRYRELGHKKPLSNIYGVDIDAQAFDFLHSIFGPTNISNRFIKDDFINVYPKDFSTQAFDVVLGNPPYVSLHNMSAKQRQRCMNILQTSPFSDDTLGRNASLWSFFLLHCLNFIKQNGRMIWVLPSSLLHACYADALLKVYKRHFKSIKLIKLNKRFFKSEGTEEVSVVLAAEGFAVEPIEDNQTGYYVAEDIECLEHYLQCNQIENQAMVANHKLTLLDDRLLSKFTSLGQQSVKLGDISRIIIGMVTGANQKFVIDRNIVEKYGLNDEDLRFVVAKFKSLKGIVHDRRKHRRAIESGERGILVCPDSLDGKSTNIRNYLATLDGTYRRKNKTFPKRNRWYFPDDGHIPDAFLSYMMDCGPRLVLNSGKINCTNTIHRVFFNTKMSFKEKKALAISMLSSYTRLSAELVGRSYGSGVLKLEPSAAKQLQILFTPNFIEPLLSIYREVCTLLDRDAVDEATVLVDGVLSNVTNVHFELFRKAVVTLKADRYEG